MTATKRKSEAERGFGRRRGAEAAPAGSTPGVAHPAPKKTCLPKKKTWLKHVTESNKTLENKIKKKSCPAKILLMYYANAAKAFLTLEGENEHPGEKALPVLPHPLAPNREPNLITPGHQ